MKDNSKNVSKEKYEKPIILEEVHMNFPVDLIKQSNFRYSCKQCSSCHGCR